MFGHQNDIISQDQRADASVPLPEETIDALTTAPATTSGTDNHDPVTSAPSTDPEPPVDNTPTVIPPTVVAPTQSLDGVIAPQSQPAPSISFPAYSPASSSSPAAYDTPAPAEDSAQPISTFPPQEPAEITPEPAHDSGNQATDEYAALLPPETKQEPPQAEPAPAQYIKSAANPEELLKIKQQALSSLSPLVGKLDVSPEEKFRTIMMLIQASDDHAFLSDAYDLAQAIPDEKARAQALLDVVNEINYFTQAHKDNQD